MRIVFQLFILIIGFVTFTFSQSPSIQWQKSFGGSDDDEGFSICLTNEGGYAITGYSKSSNGYIVNAHGFHDVWFVKIDSVGNLVMNKCFGGSSGEEAYSIIQTFDSGFVLAGQAGSIDGDVTGVHFVDDFWIVKLSESGVLEWQKCLGGTGYDVAYSIIQTTDSGYFVVGETFSNNYDVHGHHGGGEDIWAVKLNQQGTIQWSRALGGNGGEIASSCKQDANGNYWITGFTDSNNGDVSGHSNLSTDVWVVKLSSSGALLWQKCFGGGNGIDNANEIFLGNHGDFFVTAFSTSTDGDVTGNHGGEDFWLFKSDSLGNIIWEKSFGGINIEEPQASCLASDGGIVMVGFAGPDDGMVNGNHGGVWPYFADYWVVKTDSSGNFEWGKCLGGSEEDIAYDVKETTDGGYIVVGTTESSDGDVTDTLGGKDIWVVKLSAPPTSINENENFVTDLQLFQFENGIHLRFFSKRPANSSVSVYDMQGKLICSKEISISAGINYQSVLTNKLSPGIYLVKIHGEVNADCTVFINY